MNELCEFLVQFKGGFLGFGEGWIIEVIVTGPQGREVVHSEKIGTGLGGNQKKVQARVDAIASEIATNGWQPLPSRKDLVVGSSFHLPRFQR